jgi:hypothetical protein
MLFATVNTGYLRSMKTPQRSLSNASTCLALAACALSAALLGCVTEPTPESEFETLDDGAADGWASSPFAVQRKTFKINIPMNAQSLPLDGEALTTLRWNGLDKLTAIPHSDRLKFEVPERDGEFCDPGCRDQVLARAAQQGGKLPAVIRIARLVSDVKTPNGTCARVLHETVEIDFSLATHGIHPDLEATYGFLNFKPVDDGAGVTLKTIPCL